MLVTVVAKNNPYLNNALLFIHGCACITSRLYNMRQIILQKEITPMPKQEEEQQKKYLIVLFGSLRTRIKGSQK